MISNKFGGEMGSKRSWGRWRKSKRREMKKFY